MRKIFTTLKWIGMAMSILFLNHSILFATGCDPNCGIANPGIISGNTGVCASQTVTYTFSGATCVTTGCTIQKMIKVYSGSTLVYTSTLSTSSSHNFTPSSAGNYTVYGYLKISSASTYCQTASLALCVTNIPATPTGACGSITACINQTFTLSATPPSGATLRWFKGSTLIGTGNSITYSEPASGSYSYNVYSYNSSSNCTSTNSLVINSTINPGPINLVINAATNGGVGQSLTISGSATGTGLSYSWNFGLNASPATGSGVGPFNVSYSNVGAKTVSLTVTDCYGCQNTITKTINICGVAIINGPSSGCTNTNYQFTATDAGANSVYTWNFGSAASPSSANGFGPHNISYSTNGAKTVSLTVTNTINTSCSVIDNKIITIGESLNPTITALTTVLTGQNLSVSGNTSGSGVTYEWNFGSDATPATAIQGPVTLHNAWTNSNGSYSFYNTAANERILILTVGMEHSAVSDLISVSYGGKAMTQAIEKSITTGSPSYGRVEIWYIKESDLQLAGLGNKSFSFSWSANPDYVMYSAAVFKNVNQSNPIGNLLSVEGSTNPMSLPSSLSTNINDMVVAAMTCGNEGSYIAQTTGYIEGADFTNSATTTFANFYKQILTSGNENPSFLFNSAVNRQGVAAIVLNGNDILPINVVYSTTGAKTITLTVTNSTNCSTTITKEISVCDGYTINGPSSACTGSSLQFSATKVGNSSTSCGDTICWVSPTKSYVNAKTWWSQTSSTITIRTTFSKEFVDNTYGTGKIGWPGNHNFSDLTGSDKLQLALYNSLGTKSMEFKIDYLSSSSSVSSGFKSLGVTGGDGGMLTGSSSDVISAFTSLDKNFNDYGYVLTTNSPSTDANYTPNGTYPNWIYEVWYEVTVNKSAFGSSGFGYPEIASVHASPSKTGSNTEVVVTTPCIANTSWSFGSGATPATASGLGPHNVVYNTGGTKTITFNSSACSASNCTTSFTKTVIINGGSCATITAPPFNIFKDTALTYTANYIAGATYVWSATGNAIITGTGNSVNILFPTAGNQTISVLTSINGCSCITNLSIEVLIPICSGIKYNHTQSPLKTSMKNYTFTHSSGNWLKWTKKSFTNDSFHTSRKFQRNGDTAITWQELNSTTSTATIKFNRSASDLRFFIRDLNMPTTGYNEIVTVKAYYNGTLINTSDIQSTYIPSEIQVINNTGTQVSFKGLNKDCMMDGENNYCDNKECDHKVDCLNKNCNNKSTCYHNSDDNNKHCEFKKCTHKGDCKKKTCNIGSSCSHGDADNNSNCDNKECTHIGNCYIKYCDKKSNCDHNLDDNNKSCKLKKCSHKGDCNRAKCNYKNDCDHNYNRNNKYCDNKKCDHKGNCNLGDCKYKCKCSHNSDDHNKYCDLKKCKHHGNCKKKTCDHPSDCTHNGDDNNNNCDNKYCDHTGDCLNNACNQNGSCTHQNDDENKYCDNKSCTHHGDCNRHECDNKNECDHNDDEDDDDNLYSTCNDLGLYFASKVDSVQLVFTNINTSGTVITSIGISKMSWCITQPLPVIWFSINVVNNNEGGVNINWATATEINNDYFSVEKSLDNRNFIAIGKIKGAGNTNSISKYIFPDNSHSKGIKYYRIKQNDYNGEYVYSSVVSISDNRILNQIKINPNPANNNLTLSWDASIKEVLTVQITDLTGVVLKQETLPTNNNVYYLNIENIQNGIYIVNVMSNKDFLHRTKIVVSK